MTSYRHALWLLICIGRIYAAEIEIVPNNPRPFGYVVGDTVTRDLFISVRSGYELDEKSLPKPGRLGAWLELRSVEVREVSVETGRGYSLKLTYQLPNAPIEVRMVELPAHKFTFVGSGKPVEASSSEWPITLAPVTPEEVLARDGLDAVRPDIPPTGVDTRLVRWRLTGYALAIAAILLYWSYRYFGIPYIQRTRRPFTSAYREIARLNQQGDDFSQAVERVHRAFNETVGRSLFFENADHFVASRGADERLATMTRQFFALSRDEFFGGGTSDSRRSLAWVQDFCRAWRDVERGIA